MHSKELINYFSKYIEKELGIVYSEFNQYQLENRMEEMVRILGLKDLNDLYLTVQKKITPQIKQLLLDTATNNETSFFRDPKVFKAMQEHVLPDVVKRFKLMPQKKFKVWSAACSYGQEPYTLTMVMKEFFATQAAPPAFEIVATDVAIKVLDRAKTGKYTQPEISRGLAPNLAAKYFKKGEDDLFTATSDLRQPIRFQPLNLLDPFSTLGKFDLIFCRNVLIYQSVENKIAIIKRLTECLEPNGILALGAGESLIGLSDAFETVKWGDCLFYRIKSASQTAAA